MRGTRLSAKTGEPNFYAFLCVVVLNQEFKRFDCNLSNYVSSILSLQQKFSKQTWNRQGKDCGILDFLHRRRPFEKTETQTDKFCVHDERLANFETKQKRLPNPVSTSLRSGSPTSPPSVDFGYDRQFCVNLDSVISSNRGSGPRMHGGEKRSSAIRNLGGMTSAAQLPR